MPGQRQLGPRASLKLFCEAAKQDSATVELTRQVIAEVERVRGSASPSAV